MIATSLVRKCADLTYTGLRTPLVLVDRRLPEGSKARTGVDTALHALDWAKQRVSGAAEHPPAATGGPSVSPGPGEAAPDVAAPDVAEEREAIEQAVRERQADVGELADPALDVADVQAELQAKHAVEIRAEERQGDDQG